MEKELFVRNMVCDRCIQVLKGAMEESGIHLRDIDLGKLRIEGPLNEGTIKTIEGILDHHGFSLVKDPETLLVERVKIELIKLLETLPLNFQEKLSSYLASRLHQEYSGISKTFSRKEHQTIERYFIKLKIEKVKELLQDRTYNFTEIADILDYSNSNHLSGQFKSVTGMSLRDYRNLDLNTRKPLDKIL